MIRKSGSRFSEKPALGLDPGITLKQPSKARPFPQISRALDASVPLGKAARAAWITASGAPATKNPGHQARVFFRAEPAYQAAGLNSLLALALSGSTVSEATFCDNSVSSLLQAVKASNCFLAWPAHSSSASDGVFTATSSCAKSSEALVLALRISISLAEYSLAPLLALENTASIVELLLSATSLKRA